MKKAIFPMDYGRSALKRFNKADVNIVERLVNKMMHFGKKHAKNKKENAENESDSTNTTNAN